MPKQWAINLAGHEAVFWSNEDGWVEDDWTTYSDTERHLVALPMEGVWVDMTYQPTAGDLLEAIRNFLSAWDDTTNHGTFRVSQTVGTLRKLLRESL
jgi:hypothetical protein